MICFIWRANPHPKQIVIDKTPHTEMEKSSGWLPWSSLGMLKIAFNISSDSQGSHPEWPSCFSGEIPYKMFMFQGWF